MGEKLDAEVALLQQYANDRHLTYKVVDSQSNSGEAMLVGRYSTAMVRQTLSGTLPGGVNGSIHVMSTESEMRATHGPVAMNLVGITFPLPESIAFVPTVICHAPGFGMDAMASELLGQMPGGQKLKTVHFESVTVDRRFDIEVNPLQDEAWLRELFSPSFIDWLAEEAPPRLIFALDRGVLHVGVDDMAPDADVLDQLCGLAAKVGARIRDECREEATAGAARPLLSQSAARAAARPGAVPRGSGLANVGCSVIASATFMFGFSWVVLFLLGLAVVAAPGVPRRYVALGAIVPALLIAVAIGVSVVRGARDASLSELEVRPDDAAVAQAYASTHGLQLDDPADFHLKAAGLELPAVAEYVLTGALPFVGSTGSLALCSDLSDPTQPVNWTVLVTDVPSGGAPASTADLRVSTHGQKIAVVSPGAGTATAAELDGFLTSCAALLNTPT